jgi:hypothetical protein
MNPIRICLAALLSVSLTAAAQTSSDSLCPARAQKKGDGISPSTALPLRKGPSTTASPAGGPAPTFQKAVLPILKRSCVRCHNSRTRRAGLDLSSLATVKRGGDSGPAVLPGKPDDSPLYKNIATGQMPMGGKKLPAKEIQLIREWIRAGARAR